MNGQGFRHQNSKAAALSNEMQKVNLNKPSQPSGSDRIEIQLRIPDQDMARQIMEKTIELLQKTAAETTDPDEKAEALQCIQLIRRDNPQLVALGKSGF